MLDLLFDNFWDAYFISLLVTISIIFIYYYNFSPETKMLLLTIIWVESVTVMSFSVSVENVLGGKFPLDAILFVFSLITVLIFKIYNNHFLTLKDVNSQFLPNNTFFNKIGILVIISTFFLEVFLFDSELSTNSVAAIVFGIYLTVYERIPSGYEKPKEFFLFFSGFFFLIYPVGTTILRFFSETQTDAVVEIILSRPLTNFLILIGYDVWYEGNTIFYLDLTSSTSASVSISTACTGIDSVIIFLCAFLSYVIVVIRKFSADVFILCILGLMMSYFANILRMAVIILSGHYKGPEALAWSHENIGWLIFTFWIFLFWKIVEHFSSFKYNKDL